MDAEVFKKQAFDYGDFCVWYRKGGKKVFAYATNQCTSPYLKSKRKPKERKGEALVFSYAYDKYISIPYKDINNLIPLASILDV